MILSKLNQYQVKKANLLYMLNYGYVFSYINYSFILNFLTLIIALCIFLSFSRAVPEHICICVVMSRSNSLFMHNYYKHVEKLINESIRPQYLGYLFTRSLYEFITMKSTVGEAMLVQRRVQRHHQLLDPLTSTAF